MSDKVKEDLIKAFSKSIEIFKKAGEAQFIELGEPEKHEIYSCFQDLLKGGICGEFDFDNGLGFVIYFHLNKRSANHIDGLDMEVTLYGDLILGGEDYQNAFLKHFTRGLKLLKEDK